MPINYKQFIHPSDAKALSALEKVPGFPKICKAFMELINERMVEITNMSSNIRLGPNQLPEIYNLLPPICKKLGIEEPELYLQLDRNPNAFTTGDTNVCVVVTSGLLESMSLEEIQVVLAHECGHILCHHNLYTTMAIFLLNGGAALLNKGLIGGLVIKSIELALFYWMRCSEFSADRVSAYFAGSSELVSDVMMVLAGGTRNLGVKFDKELFLEQAKEYKDSADESMLNKTFEIYMNLYKNHPLTAYRAYEVTEWCKTDDFKNIDPTIYEEKTEPQEIDPNTEQLIVEHLNGSDLVPWFKKHNPNSINENVIIHCGLYKNIDRRVSKILKRLSLDKNKTIIQAIIDSKGELIKFRLVCFKTINSDLENALKQKDGYIIIK